MCWHNESPQCVTAMCWHNESPQCVTAMCWHNESPQCVTAMCWHNESPQCVTAMCWHNESPQCVTVMCWHNESPQCVTVMCFFYTVNQPVVDSFYCSDFYYTLKLIHAYNIFFVCFLRYDYCIMLILDYLIHCSLVDFSTLIYWKSPFATSGVLGVIF